MGYSIDINSSPQKQPPNSAPVTLLDSLDSSSRSHTTLSHEVSPSELMDAINERGGKSPLVHNTSVPAETLMLVDDVGANCRNNPGCSVDIASKTKCLPASRPICVCLIFVCLYSFFILFVCVNFIKLENLGYLLILEMLRWPGKVKLKILLSGPSYFWMRKAMMLWQLQELRQVHTWFQRKEMHSI